MAFFIDSLSDLVARLRAGFAAEMPGSDAFVWPNNVYASAKVFGGGLAELFGRLDYVAKQSRVSTAEGEWLDDFAAQYRMARRPAAPAMGPIAITAADAVSVVAGAQFLRSDGAAYVAAAAASISAAGTLIVDGLAVNPGSAGLAIGGTPLVAVAGGLSGPGAATATVVVGADGIVGGLDIEPDGDPYTRDLGTLRGRILFRLGNPPQGGAPSDYVLWASAVPGVTRVYVERRWGGPGTVRVFPIFDDVFAATGGIAGPAQIAAVAQEIEAQAPAGAAVVVVAPQPQPIDVTIFGLAPNTTAVQQAVLDELADTIRRLGVVAGNDPAAASVAAAMPFLAVPSTFSPSWLWQAVANASGEQRHILRAPSSAADIAITAASIPTLGRVTFATV